MATTARKTRSKTKGKAKTKAKAKAKAKAKTRTKAKTAKRKAKVVKATRKASPTAKKARKPAAVKKAKAAPKQVAPKKSPPRKPRAAKPEAAGLETISTTVTEITSVPFSIPVAGGPPAALANAKVTAVNGCVNDYMNANHPGWNDNGNMGGDYNYNNHSMRALLSLMRACLLGKHYNFNFNDDAFVQSCVNAAVWRFKVLINGRTT